MRSWNLFASFVTFAALGAAPLAGCSSADGGTGPGTPAPAGTHPSPGPDNGAVSNPPGPTTIAIKGKGSVVSADGGLVKCASDGASVSGTCTAPHYELTLYAIPADGWTFGHWEPTMSTDYGFSVNVGSATAVTAVFVPMGTAH